MRAAPAFEPVERATVAEQVRDRIHRRIVSGEMPPGAALPGERLLAEQFGVARTSLREALQGLAALGVIERRGNRSYVAERVAGSDLSAPDGGTKAVRALLEARQSLEMLLFEMAALRATARQRAEVLELARRPAPGSLEGLVVADRRFHAALAAACGNPVLVEVYGRVLDAVGEAGLPAGLLLGAEGDAGAAATIARVAAEHLRIAEAFAAGDTGAMGEEAARHRGDPAGSIMSAGRGRERRPVRGWEAWARQRGVVPPGG